MLQQLKLHNFRCFDQHSVSFQRNTVVVGKNNAGKSSIVEALQLVSTIVNRKAATFVAPPDTLELADFRACIQPKISHLGLNLDTVFHRYNEPPARITALFDGDVTVTVYISGPDAVHGVVKVRGRWVTSSSQMAGLGLPWVYVLPQIAPLKTEEYLLTDLYVADNMFSNLASRHFRNQLVQLRPAFGDFKRMAEATWPGLRVDAVEKRATKKGTLLSLPIRDGDFVGEVGLMGHGLQMWLQTIWFISRVPPDSVIVLDEPDVYMHPDLQRKLFRMTAGRFRQSVVATHSVEIMAEADPGEILVIDRKRRQSRYANSEPAVQILIDQIGGIHNVHLARLWSARKFLLVEGDDLALLRRFHAVLYPNAELSIDALPSLSIGGWGGWQRAIGAALTLKDAVGDRITCYCMLDRDYHTNTEIEKRLDEAKATGIQLHVWSAKELENFLLNPSTVRRVIVRRADADRAPQEGEVFAEMLRICETLKDTVIDGVATEIQKTERIDLVSANRRARDHVGGIWADEQRRVRAVPGKEVVSRLSEWSKNHCGVQLGAPALAREISRTEIAAEVRGVIEAIESSSPFDA